METPDGFDWIESLALPSGVDLEKTGAEWLGLARIRLAELTGAMEVETRQLADRSGYIFGVRGGELSSALLVRSSAGVGDICSVVGTGEKNLEEIELWRIVVEFSSSNLGSLGKFYWWASLGEDPVRAVAPLSKLNKEVELGGLRLVPSAGLFHEMVSSRSMDSVGIQVSYPFHVGGLSVGYSRESAMLEAGKKLKLLCALLSLVNGRVFVLRGAPGRYLFPQGDEQPDPPPLAQFSAGFPESRKSEEDNYGDPMEIRVPEWLADAWKLLERNQKLATLLVAYHEGLLLSADGHDSYALLAFVGIVETIGNMAEKKLPRCPECRMITGATQRFRDALGRVVEESEAARLGSVVYGQRSRTAHEGQLHSDEVSLGISPPANLISFDHASSFMHAYVLIHLAVVRLLAAELGGPVPEKKLTASDGPGGVIASVHLV